MDIELLKKKRATARSSFTRTAKILKDELSKDQADKTILEDKFIKIESIFNDLKSQDTAVLDLLIKTNTSEKDLETEVLSCEDYVDEFIAIGRRVRKTLGSKECKVNGSTNSNAEFSSNATNEKRFKLPKIQIKKFDGQLLSYLTFWGQFKKIHEDKELDEVDKFHYFAQSMVPGTRASELIDSYPLTAENYPKAVSAFKERFGNKEILTEIYVRELLKLIMQNVRSQGKDRLPLVSLYDKIESYIRALESLGIAQDSNAAWLYPMVESCLSADMLRVWQRSVLCSKEGSRLTNLLEFLRKEVEGEQRVKLARSGFEFPNSSRDERTKEVKFKSKKPIASAASLVVTKEKKCVFCCKNHDSKECFVARSMSLKERLEKLRESKCCLRCLKPGHFAKQCQLFIQCHLCKRSHHIILCPELPESKVESIASEKGSTTVQTAISSPICMKEVTLMTLMVELGAGSRKRKARCLLDCGSQRSYILKSTAESLNLKSISSENLTHTLFGGTRTESKTHKQYFLRLSPVGRSTEYQFSFLDQDTICGEIPRIQKGPILKELKRHRIWISDVGEDHPEIEILIGSDIYGKILTGQVIQLEGGLTAINTKLGWTLCGEQRDWNIQKVEGSQSMLVTSFLVQNMRLSDMWSLETIGIADEAQTFSKAVENQLAQEQFLNGLCRLKDGRYCVSLPWVQKFPPDIPSNRHISEKRLFATTRKLRKLEKFDEYNEVFNEWLSEGVIEIIPESEKTSGGHYLPHHPVIKESSSTTKIRPVFDASCKTDSSPSLNDCLIKGPNLVEEIPAILLRFREKAIGVTSDIKRAFLQIGIRQDDQNFLKFLWWVNGRVEEFRHKRVVFGVTSSPYLLAAVISFHLSQVAPEFRDISEKLMRSFYVDNCATSVDDKDELKQFICQSSRIMAEAKMELRLWTFGPENDSGTVAKNSDSVSMVLGLQWDRREDSLTIHIKTSVILGDLSKRKLLSLVHAVFDPLGIILPAMLPAKLILQEAWAIKSNWDIPLPDDLRARFVKWYEGLPSLSQIKLSRRIGFGIKDSWTLHVFCDASRNGYATVIFLRSQNDGEVYVKFISAKSRISPLKEITIPRLELLGCVLGARLAKYVVEALSLSNIPIYFWTDATVALSWIQREENWGIFVSNRVKEIRKLTDKECWRHIPGKINPADLPSRGCSPHHLLNSSWWEGPEFLKDPPDSWPNIKYSPDEDSVRAEIRKGRVVDLSVKIDEPQWFERFSSFSKIVKVFCWILRFANKLQKKPSYTSDTSSVEEKTKAENLLWRIVQQNNFQKIENIGKGLVVVKDNEGLIRVKSKIIDSKDEYAFRYPILLPSKNHIVTCLIRELHTKNCHAGLNILSATLREKYFVISARRAIRSVITKCIACKRFNAKACSTPPIHLPLDRVRDAATFEVVGIDLCGPLFLKNRSKVWIVLYTCAVYRAVHLELVTSLSTETFILSLRRFIARRGRPSTIYSDNGTNFTGADSALKRLNWQTIESSTSGVKPLQWKFIPPTAAWWGGWWERLIRSVKSLLLRVLGNSSVNFEELSTILCDVEAQINSRPLTYISDGSCDLVPLTPAMFLQDIPETGIPDIDAIDNGKLQLRFKHCQKLRDQLRSRFRKEYLGQLVQKANEKTHSLKVGDVVLVGQDNVKRQNWSIARIEKLFPGRDGCHRVARVRAKCGTLIRPLQRLYPLELCEESSIITDISEKVSRFGRKIKPVQRT